jgi:formate dehydrogenase iron-sulfur subunit
MKAAILTDTTKCIGCLKCVAACKKENRLGPDVPRRWDRDDGLSARNWTSIVPAADHEFVRNQCRHCLEPACVSACPVAALHKTELGPVIYDSARCMGCRYCMMACPYGIPRYQWDAAVPYVRKCILCYSRLTEGRQPACTEACPNHSTIFGDRDELLGEAHRRIGQNPGKYVDKVWGEHEAGGASVLLISDTDLSFLTEGHTLSPSPLPETTATAMEAVPFAFTGVLGAMAAVSWIIHRRMEREKDQSDG